MRTWPAAGTRAAVALAASLVACATSGKPPARPVMLGEPGCFYARDVQDFRVLDRSRLVVYAPNRANAYQVLVSPPSSDLNFIEAVGFIPATGQICGRAGDRLLLGPPGNDRRVAIIDVRRLAAADLETLGIGTPPAAPALPAPRPGPGADVEGPGQPAVP